MIKKSFIEQELENNIDLCRMSKHSTETLQSFISVLQKAREELKNRRFCITHYGVGGQDYCGLAEGNCVFAYKEYDIEKVFGK